MSPAISVEGCYSITITNCVFRNIAQPVRVRNCINFSASGNHAFYGEQSPFLSSRLPSPTTIYGSPSVYYSQNLIYETPHATRSDV